MHWRVVLAGVLLLVTAASGLAQEPSRKARVGVVGFNSPALDWGMLLPYQTRMRELGWIEDQNLTTIYRWADGEVTNYPRIVREVLESGVDVVVMPCGPPLRSIARCPS
jgi:hypothetical protein